MVNNKKKQYLKNLINIIKYSINEKKKIIIKKKKVLSRFIRIKCINAWIEYDVSRLLQISSYLILIFWILFQTAYHNTHFFIDKSEYDTLKFYIFEQDEMEELYEDALKGYQKKTGQLEAEKKIFGIIGPINATTVFFLAYCLGIGTYTLANIWLTWK